MAIPQEDSGPEARGLSESVRLLLASAVGYIHARLELFSLEAKDAASNYVKIAIVLICAVLLLVCSVLFFLMAAVYLIAWLCAWRWGWVFCGFGVGTLVIAVLLGLIAKSRFKVASFASTIAEFKKDKEWLSQTKSANPRSRTLSVVRTS